jgi:hypothetical protein
MMTADDFRRMALSLPGTVESAHMDHPDFRVGGKVFATLGYPDRNWAMVKLNPEQQEQLVRSQPGVFVPAKGAWGRGGATCLLLKAARNTVVREALATAWRNRAARKSQGIEPQMNADERG